MGWTCSSRDEECAAFFFVRSEGKKSSFGRQGHRWGIMLNKILRKQFGCVAWIRLAQVRNLWWAVVNMIMDFHVS